MKFKTEISAGGIVYQRNNNETLWLIIQNSGHKGWGFPKGLVGDKVRNESMETAALREVREEGGVEAKIVHPTPVKTQYTYRFQDYLIKKTVNYFLMEYVSGQIEDHDQEVGDIKFVSADEVRQTLTYKADKEAFEEIFSIFGAVDRI